MKILYVLPVMLAVAACDKPKERTESHIESSEITAVGTFSGDDIKATVAGDRVEIRNREVEIDWHPVDEAELGAAMIEPAHITALRGYMINN